MNIEDLTIKQARELSSMLGGASPTRRLPFASLGTNVFVATITAHYTGRVVAVSEEEIAIEDAAWIADDGRFSGAMKSGEFSEVEPFPDGDRVMLNRSTFLFWRVLPQTLPRSQK
jgi:hypothetical protein